MTSARILCIDQGTTGSTCLVLDLAAPASPVVGKGYREFPQHFPRPGWVEHDLEEIWSSVQGAMRDALASAPGTELAAIGITNQRETTAIWDQAGRPIHRAIVWQDRRTAPQCEALKQAGHAELVTTRTGLVIDPYFSGTKVAWLLDHVAGARQAALAGTLRFGTIDTWLLWKLSGGKAHVTDVTNASRTMLFDIHELRWDAELCALLGDVPQTILPRVLPSAGELASTKGVDGIPDGIVISGVAGDQQAALFGQACFEPGMAKCTYGTGAFVLLNTGSAPMRSRHGLVTTIAWQVGGETTYALEGSVFVAGALVQWLRDGLGLIRQSKDIEALAASVPSSDGVLIVPALTGLGAPHWKPDARGVISGLSRGTTKAHLARAALDGIAFQVHDLLDAMAKDAGRPVDLLRVDGGAAANNLLLQFQADLLGRPIHRPKMLETTALGAGFLAALGAGLVQDKSDIARSWQRDRTFARSMDEAERTLQLARWHKAVASA